MYACVQALDIRSNVLDDSLVSSAVDAFRKIEMYRSPAEKILCVVRYTAVCMYVPANSFVIHILQLLPQDKCISILYEILTSAQHAKKAEQLSKHQQLDQEAARVKEDSTLLGDQSIAPPLPRRADLPDPAPISSSLMPIPPLSAPVALGADDLLPLFIWVVLRSQCPCLYSNCAYIQAFLSPVRLLGQAGYSLVNLESAIAFLTEIGPESLNIDPEDFKRKMKAAEEQQMLLEQQQQQQR